MKKPPQSNSGHVSQIHDADSPPKVKFQPDAHARTGAEAIAEHHRFGKNGESVNEFAKLVFTRCSQIRPELFWDAMAALRPFIAEAKGTTKP